MKDQEEKKIPLTLVYGKYLPNIRQILYKHAKLLYSDKRLKEIFENNIIVAYKRGENIQDILVHRKHNNVFFKIESGTKNCGKNCAICKHIIVGSTFNDNTGKEYNTIGEINCKTTNVIYGIRCMKCSKLVYVGETGGTLYQRMLLNLSRMRTKAPDPIANHFNEINHSADDYKIVGIEKTNREMIFRRVKESMWIKKMKTLKPNGLNKCT